MKLRLLRFVTLGRPEAYSLLMTPLFPWIPQDRFGTESYMAPEQNDQQDDGKFIYKKSVDVLWVWGDQCHTSGVSWWEIHGSTQR